MSDELRLQLLFHKYLRRNCSAEEVGEFLHLLQKADAESALDDEMRAVWEEIRTNPHNDSVDWNRMYATIRQAELSPDNFSRRPRLIRRWISGGIAASVLLLGSYLVMNTSRHEAIRSQKDLAEIGTSKKVMKTPNDRQTIHLPDGSTAILNSNSKLNYPSSFTNNRRDVYLTGEGFFDIQHNPRQPFFVHIGKISIKVLGTAFNIRTSSTGDDVEVTVTRGKVQVLKENKSVGFVTASQQLSYNLVNAAVTTRTVDTLPVIAWKPEEIFFNDLTLAEAALKLEKRFGMEVEFANPAIRNCRFTATFSEDDLAEEIMTVICAVTKTDFSTDNTKIIINGKGCE